MDYAAATPLHKRVARLMVLLQKINYANPSSIHKEGRIARELLEATRLRLARLLVVQPQEVFFTASGTEGNNLAIEGYLRAQLAKGKKMSDLAVITTPLEHPSITEVLKGLVEEGLEVRQLDIDKEGKVMIPSLEKALDEKAVLLAIHYANSEIGVVQNIKKISKTIRHYNQKNTQTVKILLDACQAPLWLPCQVPSLGVDVMTLDAGKCNGPKGVGILVKKSDVELLAIIQGGGQESGLRAGTENLIGIVGAVEAIVLAQESYRERSEKVRRVSKVLWEEIEREIPEAVFNGPAITADDRVPNNVHISLLGYDTEFTVVELDEGGVAASTKSACSGAGGGESTVVLAISGDAARAKSTLRFTLDPTLTARHIRHVAKLLRKHIDKMKPYSNTRLS